MRLHLPRRRVWRVAIYLVSLVLVLLAADLLLVEWRRTIRPGYETTRIVAPLQADGSVDYLAAMDEYFGRGITAENNAAPLLLEALGRSALPANQPPDGITERLGMPHLPERGDYFVSSEEFAKGRADGPVDPDPTEPSRPVPWPAAPSAATLAWLKANEGPLARIEAATQRPRFFIPFYGGSRPETLAAIALPYLLKTKEVHRALLTRAIARLQGGDVEGCRRDLLTVHRLARLVGQGPTMIERLVAARLEVGACWVERAAAASGKFSAAQARALATDLAGLPDLPPMADGMDVGERFFLLDSLQLFARVGPARTSELLRGMLGHDLVPPPLFRLVPVPYEQAMRVGNHWYDACLAAARQPTYPRRAAALRLYEQDLVTLAQRHPVSRLLSADWPVTLLMPAVMSVQQRWESARMQNRLSQVALALAAFKADHGAYPATLAELAPSCLGTVPMDLFTERPLVYSRTPAGYTLYSAGPNMVDDGGKSDQPADDLVASQP